MAPWAVTRYVQGVPESSRQLARVVAAMLVAACGTASIRESPPRPRGPADIGAGGEVVIVGEPDADADLSPDLDAGTDDTALPEPADTAIPPDAGPADAGEEDLGEPDVGDTSGPVDVAPDTPSEPPPDVGGCGWVAPPAPGWAGGCAFPQGVPDESFIGTACAYQDTDPAVDAAVNAVMTALSGCGVGSDCALVGVRDGSVEEVCQAWFAAVTQALRDQGYCAGQHAVGSTDEIAVSDTGCAGKWYGYHICFYGGPKVVWNPGARRGWWAIDPAYCP